MDYTGFDTRKTLGRHYGYYPLGHEGTLREHWERGKI